MSEVEPSQKQGAPFDMNGVFRRGGRELVDLLEYLVLSVQMDPVFLFLAGEFRTRPTALRAVALYDVFCAPKAGARVSAVESVPPRDVRLKQEIEALRTARERATEPRNTGAPTTSPDAAGSTGAEGSAGSAGSDSSAGTDARRHLGPPLMAPKYLFDGVTRELGTGRAAAAIAAIEARYDPDRTPHENLPGGRLTAGQRAFVDQLWVPRLRPYLVAAGFRRIANIA